MPLSPLHNSPLSTSVENYRDAWRAADDLLRQGASWSGEEPNCCFLNLGGGSFAEIAPLWGADLRDDSRATAVSDWDLDGDLDLWLSNRTSPRVRFLQNRGTTGQNYLTLRLEAVHGNRDAIGSRIRLETGGEQPQILSRTVRAGEGYLTQSSKRQHFGLGSHGGDVTLTVWWPNGERQTFEHVATNRHYFLRQSEALATGEVTPIIAELVDEVSP